MRTEGTPRSGRSFASLVALAVATLVAACGAAPTLTTPTDDIASVSMSNVAYDAPRSIGAMSLCLTAPARATITQVALHEPTGDITVDAFGLRSNPSARGMDGIGALSGTLDEVDGEDNPWHRDVAVVCPEASQTDAGSDPPLDEFAVQVSFASGEWSGGPGLDVTYQIDGVEHTVVIPFGIWLCARTCPQNLGS